MMQAEKAGKKVGVYRTVHQYFTSRTVPGRYFYAMGGNEKAAKLSGINTNRVLIGAVFRGVLNNGMSILGVDANWQKVVKGLVLLAAVVFDVVSKRKSRNVA